MARFMKCTAAIILVLSVIWGVLNFIFDTGLWLSLTITFGTIAYHLTMRLLVGSVRCFPHYKYLCSVVGSFVCNHAAL